MSLWPQGLWPARLLYPWDFSSKNTGASCYFLLQVIFLTQDWTRISCISRRILYQLNYQEALSPFLDSNKFLLSTYYVLGTKPFCYCIAIQLLSCVWLFVTPGTAARQASLSITNSRSLLNLMSIESMMPSNHFILCYPLLLLPPIPPGIRVFSSESTLCMR